MTSGSHISPTVTQKQQPARAAGAHPLADNTIVNNVSAHEGGGIALDDAVFVDVVDNTIAEEHRHHGHRRDQPPASVHPGGVIHRGRTVTRCRLASQRPRVHGDDAIPRPFPIDPLQQAHVQFNDVYYDNRAGSNSFWFCNRDRHTSPTVTTAGSTTGTWAPSTSRPSRACVLAPRELGG